MAANKAILKTSYPFIKHIPVAAVMSGSHVSGRAMTLLRWTQITGPHCFIYRLLACLAAQLSGNLPAISTGLLPVRRLQAAGTMILLSGHKVERDKTVATSGDSSERTSEG